MRQSLPLIVLALGLSSVNGLGIRREAAASEAASFPLATRSMVPRGDTAQAIIERAMENLGYVQDPTDPTDPAGSREGLHRRQVTLGLQQESYPSSSGAVPLQMMVAGVFFGISGGHLLVDTGSREFWINSQWSTTPFTQATQGPAYSLTYLGITQSNVTILQSVPFSLYSPGSGSNINVGFVNCTTTDCSLMDEITGNDKTVRGIMGLAYPNPSSTHVSFFNQLPGIGNKNIFYIQTSNLHLGSTYTSSYASLSFNINDDRGTVNVGYFAIGNNAYQRVYHQVASTALYFDTGSPWIVIPDGDIQATCQVLVSAACTLQGSSTYKRYRRQIYHEPGFPQGLTINANYYSFPSSTSCNGNSAYIAIGMNATSPIVSKMDDICSTGSSPTSLFVGYTAISADGQIQTASTSFSIIGVPYFVQSGNNAVVQWNYAAVGNAQHGQITITSAC